MGLGFRAPTNKLAISISFGSYGFSDVLVRVFKKVRIERGVLIGRVVS